RRHVRCEELRTGRRYVATLSAKRDARQCLDSRAACGQRRNQGTVRDERCRRHSKPPPDIYLLPRECAEGNAVLQGDRLEIIATCVSASGKGPGSGSSDGVLSA